MSVADQIIKRANTSRRISRKITKMDRKFDRIFNTLHGPEEAWYYRTRPYYPGSCSAAMEAES